MTPVCTTTSTCARSRARWEKPQNLEVRWGRLTFPVPPCLTASGTILSNLPTNGVISPQHLAPEHLLTPYLPKSDLTLAYPLGPPVSAARTLDPFVRFGISPLASPMNPYLRTEFCTTMGKIKSRGKTGLQRSSQRQMGKAVRRARVSLAKRVVRFGVAYK